jgi:NAD(P)-dependent dehydrogenase (short-subunit alcohol dehydrogenase family)
MDVAGLHPTVVITGATGAIGSAAAAVLVARGARLLLLARPTDRLDSIVERLQSDKRVLGVGVNLAVLSSVRRAAREIARSAGHVDALIHAAAVFSNEFRKTADGFELMLATNHLGPFVLTNLLRDQLVGGGRVITVSAPSTTRVNFDHLLSKDHFRPQHTFGATKAASLMFTFELGRRAKRWDVRANAFHPGVVRSELMHEASRPIRLFSRLLSRSADRAAGDLAELAISPAFEGTTGWFVKGIRRIDAPRSTLDVDAQQSLWARTAELVELEKSF